MEVNRMEIYVKIKKCSTINTMTTKKAWRSGGGVSPGSH